MQIFFIFMTVMHEMRSKNGSLRTLTQQNARSAYQDGRNAAGAHVEDVEVKLFGMGGCLLPNFTLIRNSEDEKWNSLLGLFCWEFW